MLAGLYRACLDSDLRRALDPGDIVIMDNLGSHKNHHARDAIEARGATSDPYQSLRVMLDVGESKRQSACQIFSANLSIPTVLARHASA